MQLREAAPGGFGGHHAQHVVRQVVGHHRSGVRRHGKTHVAAAAAEVEHLGMRRRLGQRGQGIEVGALRVHGAGEIGLRDLAELPVDESMLLHGGSFLVVWNEERPV